MSLLSVPDLGELTEWETFGVARRRARVTQVAIAEVTGIFQTQVSAWERTGQGLRREQIERIWNALDQLQKAA